MGRWVLAEYLVPPHASVEPAGELARAVEQFGANRRVRVCGDGSRMVTWWVDRRTGSGDGRVELEYDCPVEPAELHGPYAIADAGDRFPATGSPSFSAAKGEPVEVYDYGPAHQPSPYDVYYLAVVSRDEQRLLGPFRNRDEFMAAAEPFAFDSSCTVVVIAAP